MDSNVIYDDLNLFVSVFPEHISSELYKLSNFDDLLEIALDIGRVPEVRFGNASPVFLSKEIQFEDFNFDQYYGYVENPKESYIIFRDSETKKVYAKIQTNSILQDDEVGGPMTNAFASGSTFASTTGGSSAGYGSDSYGSTEDMPIDVNAIILDWIKQIKMFY